MGKAAWCILGAVALMGEVIPRLLGKRSDSLEARVKKGAHISCHRGEVSCLH